MKKWTTLCPAVAQSLEEAGLTGEWWRGLCRAGPTTRTVANGDLSEMLCTSLERTHISDETTSGTTAPAAQSAR
jgi:hypothetical protein